MNNRARRIFSIASMGLVGGVAWMFVSGRWDWNEAKVQSEALVFEGAGAIASMKGTSRKGDPAQAAACRENLRLLENAKRRVVAEKGEAGGPVTLQELAAVMGGLPTCPGGGRYEVGASLRLPSCSIGTNGTTEKRDDHVLVSH